MADQYTPLPVKTKNTNDLSVQLRNPANSAFMGDATTPVVITVNNTTLPVTAAQLPAALGQTTMANSLAVTLASNQTALPVSDNSGSLTVDAPTATPVPMAITTTADVLVKAGDSGNNAVRVNVVAGGGSTSPTTPTRSYQTISALAISTRTAINFTEIGTTLTARLSQLIMASSVTCKWELFTLTNSVESTTALAVFFTTSSHPTFTWTPPHPNYVQIIASAGTDNFRLYATNLDNALAADVYSTSLWDLA